MNLVKAIDLMKTAGLPDDLILRTVKQMALADEEKKARARAPSSRRRLPGNWEALRYEVFERDGYRCVYCSTEADSLECDHVIPISRGGSSDISNLATACRPCNLSKSDMTPLEWRGH